MKISVLTPSYKAVQYIERAIQSVLRQDYTHYEHIVVDGGSKDGTIEMLGKYPHLKWVSEPDRGQSDAMNKAFAMATGDVIVYLNADDEFEPGAFAAVVDTFSSHSDVQMAVGKLRIISGVQTLYRLPTDRYADIIRYWLHRFPANPVSYFYKREIQLHLGDFPLDRYYTMDVWFLLLVYQRFKVKKIDAVLGTFHFTGENKTAHDNVDQTLHKEVRHHLINNDQLRLVTFYCAWLRHHYLTLDWLKEAIRDIVKSFR